jgi:hypothetical protein
LRVVEWGAEEEVSRELNLFERILCDLERPCVEERLAKVGLERLGRSL